MTRFTVVLLVLAACGSSSRAPPAPQSITVAPATAPPITTTEPANPAPETGAKAFLNSMLVKHAKVDTLALHPAAEKWRVDHVDGGCPTIERLHRERGTRRRVGTADDITTPDTH